MQTRNYDDSTFTIANAFSLWTWLSLATSLVMLTHQSDTPLLLGRYSALVSVTVGGLLLATVLGFIGTRATTVQESLSHWLANWQTKGWWSMLIYGSSAILILVITFFFLGNFPPQYAFLRAYIVTSIILWAVMLAGAPRLSSSWVIGLALLAGLLILGGMVLVADIFPPLARTDEAFTFSMGRNFIETGSRTPTIYAPALGEQHYVGWVWYRALGAWLATIGMTLHSARLHMLALTVLIGGILGITARHMYGSKVGAVTFTLALAVFIPQIFIRFDLYASLWATMSIAFYVFAREKTHILWHVAVGFCAGMMLDSSPAGFAIGAGYATIYTLRYVGRIRRKQWLWMPFWGLAVGGSLATMLFFASIQSGSLPEAGYEGGALSGFIVQLTANLAPERLLDMINQTLRAFWGYQPILSVLAVLGVWWIIRRDTSPLQRDWLIMLSVWFALILVAYPYFPRYYLVFGLPIVVLVATEALRYLPSLGIALLIVWLLSSLVYGYLNRGSESLEDVVHVGENIAQIIPHDSVIVGAEPYYFGLLDHENFVGGAIENNMRVFKNVTSAQAWEIVAPDALIFSGNWSHEPARTEALESYMQTYEFYQAGCWLADSYGRIELWTKPDIAPIYEGDCVPVD